jgi:hypothetical protein
MKHRALVLMGLLMLLVVTVLAADDDRTQSTRPNPPGMPQEGYVLAKPAMNPVPDDLIERHKNALEAGNVAEAQRLEGIIRSYRPALPMQKVNADPDQQATQEIPMMSPVWSTADVLVYSGSVTYGAGYGGSRMLDMKRGEDGNLYLAVNRIMTSYTGRVDVYKSTNGGANWTFVSGLQSTTAYFGEISMLVEVRGSTFDSTRIVLFYTRSASSNMASAAIRYASFLRDGTVFLGGAVDIETPGAGRKFGSPSALSDGAYYSAATYLGVVAAEYSNDGDSTKSLRFWQSTNWGTSFTSTTVSASYQDFNPTAALKPGSSATTDSVYIAVERRFSTSNYLVRVIATKFNSPTTDVTYYLPPSEPTAKYQKPYIHVRQTGRAYGTNRDIIITAVKNGNGIYHQSVGSTVSWSLDYDLAKSVNVGFTFCSSDSLTAGGGYFLAAYTDVNGDTLGIRRGVPGSLGTRLYRNSHPVSTSIMPVSAIYKVGATKYSAYAYAGFGPVNVYFNQENLPATAVKPDGPLPLEYGLDQNYPNPFNPETFIGFRVAQAGRVKLQVFDLLGREVAVLMNEQKDPGGYQVRFDASALPTGVYLYRLTAGNYVEAKKLVLVR